MGSALSRTMVIPIFPGSQSLFCFTSWQLESDTSLFAFTLLGGQFGL